MGNLFYYFSTKQDASGSMDHPGNIRVIWGRVKRENKAAGVGLLSGCWVEIETKVGEDFMSAYRGLTPI